MANFANTATGRVLAETLCKTRIAAGVWVVAHMAIDKAGNTICRFIRYMSPTNPGYGAWVESRADDQDA